MIKKIKELCLGARDGRIRAMFLKDNLDQMYQYLVNLKRTFDSNNLLNPDVIISNQDMIKNIRNVQFRM